MLICPASQVSADDTEGFYASFAPQLYYADRFYSLLIPGARIGAGWEMPLLGNSLLLGMEAGIFYTGDYGNNPVPAAFSLNGLYNYRINEAWSLNGGLAMGIFLAPRYETGAAFPFFSPRISGEWDFLRGADGGRFLSAYFGGGLDIDVDAQLFVMPLIEAGVRLRFGRTHKAAPSIDESSFVEDEFIAEDDDNGGWEETPRAELAKQPEPAPPPRKPPAQTPPSREQPKIEPAPVVVPGTEQKTESNPERLPRGSRPLVVMADGRQGFILEECTIYFGPDLTPINPAEEAKLRRALLLLKQYPNERFIVAGYAALAGTEQGQNVVSWERVRNVTDYLVRQGIKAGRGEVHWFGSDRAAASNTDRAAMALNRRVEIIILDN